MIPRRIDWQRVALLIAWALIALGWALGAYVASRG